MPELSRLNKTNWINGVVTSDVGPSDVVKWTSEDVGNWLNCNGFQPFSNTFIVNYFITELMYPTFHEYFAFPAFMRSGRWSRLSAGQRMRPRDSESRQIYTPHEAVNSTPRDAESNSSRPRAARGGRCKWMKWGSFIVNCINQNNDYLISLRYSSIFPFIYE